jgi:TolA-binding protein
MEQTIQGYIKDIDAKLALRRDAAPQESAETPPPAPAVDPRAEAVRVQQQIQKVAELYRQSMTQYRAGELAQARTGFLQVVESHLIPPQMEQTIQGYIKDIDARLGRGPGGSPQER